MAIPSGPEQTSIHSIFEWQAADLPEYVCVISENRTLTYGELNAQANRLARRLNSLGVANGTLVALCMQPCPEMLIALLAILKAGGAYVPLDPQFPDHRTDYLLRDTAAQVVILHSQTIDRLRPLMLRTATIPLNADDPSEFNHSETNLDRPTSTNDLACVMYTSGSTGNPKGVLVGHRGVIRLVHGTDYCRFGPDEVFLQLAPLAFDASTFEIWGPLLNGSRLVLLPPGPPTPEAIRAAIERHEVTTLWLTAGLFHLMVDQCVDALKPIRQLLAGGDVLSPPHVQKALAVLDDGVVINGYGPTENTTFTCCFRMDRDYQVTGSIPIGRPIAHTAVHILDEKMNPVPLGEPGELYTSGAGVAFGYLNDPDLTRARFLTNPFGDPAERIYRTGDLVRCRPDGNLEFLGRVDNQLKLRGYRVEPGEIEANILRHPEILQAVVLPYIQATGGKHLVAYFVASESCRFSAPAMRRFLADYLPQPLIPALFFRLDRFPLNANGKVDRSALPPPQIHPPGSDATAERTETETTLVALWAGILNCEVGLDENFFDLGGNSLQLIHLHSKITSILGRQLPVTVLFEKTTIRTLARWLDGNASSASTLIQAHERADRQKRAFAQRTRRGFVG